MKSLALMQLRTINAIFLTSYREYHNKSSHPIQSQRDIVWNSSNNSDINTLPHPLLPSSLPSQYDHDHQKPRPHPRLPINPRPFRMPDSVDNVLASLLTSNV